jgi:hypothetical protein
VGTPSGKRYRKISVLITSIWAIVSMDVTLGIDTAQPELFFLSWRGVKSLDEGQKTPTNGLQGWRRSSSSILRLNPSLHLGWVDHSFPPKDVFHRLRRSKTRYLSNAVTVRRHSPITKHIHAANSRRYRLEYAEFPPNRQFSHRSSLPSAGETVTHRLDRAFYLSSGATLTKLPDWIDSGWYGPFRQSSVRKRICTQ